MLPQEMCADLVVEDTSHTAHTILARHFDVHFAFACFGIMRNTSGRDLILLEVDRYPFLYAKVK